MAKEFKEYTIEDLYRLNFSFLIKSIKEKELEDASCTEEVFIKGQKLALMNIFTALDAKQIDPSRQVIEPFLSGRRLLTDLNSITAVIETLSKEELAPIIEVQIPEGLSAKWATAMKVKIGDRNHEDKLYSIRAQIGQNEEAINNYNAEILRYSRAIADHKKEVNDLMILIANEKLKPQPVSRFTEFTHHLIKNKFKIVGISTTSDGLKINVHTLRTCELKVANPDRRNNFFELPLLVGVRFVLYKNSIEVMGDRPNTRRIFYKSACSYPHPHISNSDSGSFCLGNTATLLSNMIKNGVYNNIGDFIKVYADLLDNYNPESPYRVLQEVFLNNACILLSARQRYGQFNDDDTVESIDLNDEMTHTLFTKVGDSVRENYTTAIESSLTADAIIEHLELLKSKITSEAMDFVENSNVSVEDAIPCYFTDEDLQGLGGYRDTYIKLLRIFGGV
jgi:hypothetical protein